MTSGIMPTNDCADHIAIVAGIVLLRAGIVATSQSIYGRVDLVVK
jgi:hypothetical protein